MRESDRVSTSSEKSMARLNWNRSEARPRPAAKCAWSSSKHGCHAPYCCMSGQCNDELLGTHLFLQKHPGSVSRWIETPTSVAHNHEAVKRIPDIAVAELEAVSAEM